MGKTVVTILIVVAAVAVNVIPGVGQAISGALISAGLATAATAATITASLTAAITGLAISAVTQLLVGSPDLPKPATATTSIKTPIPPRVSGYGRCRVHGAYIFYENSRTNAAESDTFAPFAMDAYVMHDGKIQGIVQRYLGDDKVTVKANHYIADMANNQYSNNLVRWDETLGDTPGTANWGHFVSASGGKWTANSRGDGCVCVGIWWFPPKAEDFNERLPHGTPPASIVADCQLVYDPRDGTQNYADPSTWKYSDNPVLALMHYRLVREKARVDPTKQLPAAADLTAAWLTFFEPTKATWIAAANVCDELVPMKDGSTEKRYRLAFLHQHSDPHKKVLDAITATFDGWTAARADGALVCYAGKIVAPTVTIGPDDIASYSLQFNVKDEEAINEIRLSFISPAHDYNVVECDPWRDFDDMAQRGGVRSIGLDLSVPSHGQMRRLAKRQYARVMTGHRGVITTMVSGRKVRGHRWINLNIVEAGQTLFSGIVEIVQLTRNISTGGVSFAWAEVDPNIDTWNPATEEGLKPTPTLKNLPDPPAAPVITSTGASFETAADQSVGARVVANLAGPSGTDLTWYLRWRKVGSAVWNEQRYSDVDSSAAVQLISNFVPTGANIEIEVAYAGGNGFVSPWSATATQSTNLYDTPPDAATAITLLEWTDRMRLSTPPIGRASNYRWRFYESDGVTLRRTITTTTNTVEYVNVQAELDGIRRSYKVEVAGVNNAGAGTAVMSATLNHAAPAAPSGFAATGGTYTGSLSFTTPVTGAAGYVGYYHTAAGFNPLTTGNYVLKLDSPIVTPALAAGTYYGKVAAYDLWTRKPDLLNFTAEGSFTITTGSTPGGSGGGGGGYCVTEDVMIEMADGYSKAAGSIIVGDMVHTQHEDTMEWGNFMVTDVAVVDSTDVWEAMGVKASGDHRLFVDAWVRIRDIGEPSDDARVVRITVDDAHTYYSNGILSHNMKPIE